MLVRIGITCNLVGLENRLSQAYILSVSRTGALPLLLPVVKVSCRKLLKSVDGLILSGGGDPDARHYGEDALPVQGTVQPLRDRFELDLAREAIEAGLPVLGICRGVQILNIAAGGTLHQDLQGVAGLQHDQKAPRSYPIHNIRLSRSSMLYKITGEEEICVNSFHHQAVKTVGSRVIVTACAGDDVIEAVEVSGHPFAIGVQWHPEWLGKLKHARSLFRALTQAASIRKRCKRVCEK